MIVKKYFLSLFSLLIFSGCLSVSNKVIDKQLPIIDTTKKIKTKVNHCLKYEKNMKYAFSYIFEEFDKGYFRSNDLTGAKAQLFLIKNKSESVFAQNINSAESFYKSEYQMAKKQKCPLSKYTLSPLTQIETKIIEMDNSSVKTTLK
jgi:hypothetical protein